MTNSDFMCIHSTYKNQKTIQPTYTNQKANSIVKK